MAKQKKIGKGVKEKHGREKGEKMERRNKVCGRGADRLK
jgi:hypothetical protein